MGNNASHCQEEENVNENRYMIFRVGAYTGFDWWYYLLPEAAAAKRVAKRAYPNANSVFIQVPSGAFFLVENGKAKQVPAIEIPF